MRQGPRVAVIGLDCATPQLLFGDGTALTFILVATGFLGLTIIGWRLIAARIVDDG